jgi:hypothetical protein
MYTFFYAVAKILPFPWLPWFQSRVMLLILYIPGVVSILPLVFRDIIVQVIDTPVEARIARASVWWLLTAFFGFLPTWVDAARWILDYALSYYTFRP